MRYICLGFLLAFTFPASFAQERIVNYDEDKVGTYTLPNILKTEDGKRVETVKVWENVRRPQILTLFENEVYGQMPQNFDKLEFSVLNSNEKVMDGKAHMKEVQIEVFKDQESVQINLVLFVPSKRKGPVPAFLLINNRSERNTAPLRDTISGFWPAEIVINADYAVAAFQVDDAAPDNKDTYAQGVLNLYPEQLQKDNGMKAIGAWGWAASRIMDYFEKNDDIDASKVVLVGHSRGGKASLWAAAEDPRFAICVSNNSGNTGAALSRRWFGETVEIINTSFPHWFNENYKKYNDKEKDLPVDQHMLIGLIAPRPVYVTSASLDLWADPKGTFLAMKEAEPVYNLYDLRSSLPSELPPTNTPIINSPMGYHIREGKHNLTDYDWSNFIKFADFHFQKSEE
ncbi:MAG: acetylxylan esterase [Anditalea sp.]